MESEIAFKVLPSQPCWLNRNRRNIFYPAPDICDAIAADADLRSSSSERQRERSHRFSCCYLAHCVGLQQVEPGTSCPPR
ncbi:hypothetical protein F2P79_006305 [Pimephales promelas]|nr:hypothetical protein F2P79_006305 [Pimephales promelas]